MNAPLRSTEVQWTYPTAFSGWGCEEHMAIARVVASGQFTCGEEVERLEYDFKTAHGMSHAVAVNSGSSANLVAVAAIRPRISGSVAAVPALAWSTTFAPLVQHGLDLALIDCDETWNASAWHRLSALVIACPILGNPAWLAGTAKLAKDMNVPLIVDNCESVGAEDEYGNLTGTQGILNTFSFYYSHQMSAIEGGMILTNDDDLARKCRILKNHGWTRGTKQAKTFADEYEFASFGYNVRPIELHAAIAREQLKKLPARIKARNANFAYFSEQTRDLPIKLPKILGKPSFFGIHFTVEGKEKRAELAKAFRAQGIDCRPPVAGSFRKQPYGKKWADQETPNADRIHDTGIMIGSPPFDGSHLIDRAVRVMREVL